MPEETEPPKRPGRPRKAATTDVGFDTAPPAEPSDERIGQPVDAGVSFISFPDGSEYRCAKGKIVERVR